MFNANFTHKEITSPSQMFPSLQESNITQATGLLVQTRSLLCTLAQNLQLGMKITFDKNNRYFKQTYLLIDSEGSERLRITYKSLLPMSGVSKLVREPKSIGHLNRVINQIPNFSKENETEPFRAFLQKLVYLNEEDFFIDGYAEEEYELSVMLESKQGNQVLELLIEN